MRRAGRDRVSVSTPPFPILPLSPLRPLLPIFPTYPPNFPLYWRSVTSGWAALGGTADAKRTPNMGSNDLGRYKTFARAHRDVTIAETTISSPCKGSGFRERFAVRIDVSPKPHSIFDKSIASYRLKTEFPLYDIIAYGSPGNIGHRNFARVRLRVLFFISGAILGILVSDIRTQGKTESRLTFGPKKYAPPSEVANTQ